MENYELTVDEFYALKADVNELQKVWEANPELKNLKHSEGIRSSQVISLLALQIIKNRRNEKAKD